MEVTPQIIQDVEDGKVEGIRLVEKKGRTIYLVDCILNGCNVKREVGFLNLYNRLIRTGISQEDAILQAKTEALIKCFRLKVEGVLEVKKSVEQTFDVERFCSSLASGNGTINGITIETDYSRSKDDPYFFRLRVTINGNTHSTALKIFTKKRGFPENFYLIITRLCMLYGLTDEQVEEASKRLTDTYFKEYKEYLHGLKFPSLAKQAA